MDAVVKLQVHDGDDGRVGNLFGQPALSVLHRIPILGVARVDEAADLDVIKGKVGLVEVSADGGDEVGESFGENLGGLRVVGVAFALVPEHALDLPASQLHLTEHGAVKALPPLGFGGGVPLRHAGAAVSGGHEADRDPGGVIKGDGEGKAEPRALGAALVLLRGAFFAVFRIAGMNGIRGVDEPVKGLLGAGPLAFHAESVDLRVRGFHISEVAIAFHIGLAREQPEVAHKDVLDLNLIAVFVGVLHVDSDAVRAASGDAEELAVLEAGRDQSPLAVEGC